MREHGDLCSLTLEDKVGEYIPKLGARRTELNHKTLDLRSCDMAPHSLYWVKNSIRGSFLSERMQSMVV